MQGPVDKTRDRFGSRLNPIRQLNVISPDMLLAAKILSLGKPCNPLNFIVQFSECFFLSHLPVSCPGMGDLAVIKPIAKEHNN